MFSSNIALTRPTDLGTGPLPRIEAVLSEEGRAPPRPCVEAEEGAALLRGGRGAPPRSRAEGRGPSSSAWPRVATAGPRAELFRDGAEVHLPYPTTSRRHVGLHVGASICGKFVAPCIDIKTILLRYA